MTEEKTEVTKRIVETIGPDDPNNYTVIVQATYKDEKGTETKQILNLFAKNTDEAYAWLLDLRRLYDQPGIVGVKLMGVYRRTTLKVIDEQLEVRK